jgi:hypothetical protein
VRPSPPPPLLLPNTSPVTQPTLADTSPGFSLLSLPADLLRYVLFHPHGPVDRCTQLVCRHVCRLLRQLIPCRAHHEHIELFAARDGHLKLLQWLRGQGAVWHGDGVTALAALGGHLELLQWAYRQGATLSESATFMAAEGGHLNLLQWVRGMGAPFSQRLCSAAAGR